MTHAAISHTADQGSRNNSPKSRECRSSKAADALSPGCGTAAIYHTADQGSRFPYEDIVNTPWPRPTSDAADGTFREYMSLDDRAKIFAPFAALKGFEEALEERARRLL